MFVIVRYSLNSCQLLGVSNFAKKSNVLHNDSLRATSLDGKFAQSSARSPARENEKSICRLTASLSGAAVRHKVEHGLDIFGVKFG